MLFITAIQRKDLLMSYIFSCVSTGLKGSCLCDCVKSYLHQYLLIMIQKLAAE